MQDMSWYIKQLLISHSASESSEYNSRSTLRSIARFDNFYNKNKTSSEAGSSVLIGVL
jgi:hypothetical protein